MASLSRVLLECLLPLLAQEAPTAAPPQQPVARPWVLVDSPQHDPHGLYGDLQLVVLSDGTYVGSYQLAGHWGVNMGTHVVRSRDRGATWERIAKLDHLHDVSLIEHDDVVWLLGIEGDKLDRGPVSVMCLRDTAGTWVGGTSRLRSSHPLSAEPDTMLHAGRVWRSFSHDMDDRNVDLRTLRLVASAALGSDLQDPASWRWSSEVPSDGVNITLFTVTWKGELALAITEGRELGRFADIGSEGWELSLRRDLPTWKLPGEAWNSRFVRDPSDGRCYLLSGESTRAAEPPDRPRNALVLRSSQDFRVWDRTELLHDLDATPVAFGPAAVLVEGDDIAALISFEDPPPSEAGMPDPLRIAFLRVPKFR